MVKGKNIQKGNRSSGILLTVLLVFLSSLTAPGCNSSKPPPERATSDTAPSDTSPPSTAPTDTVPTSDTIPPVQVPAKHILWVSAYYAGWMQKCDGAAYLRAQQIDFSAVTHIIHFSLMPNPDGSIDDSMNCLTPENSQELLTAAHAAGKKVLISVGSWDTETDFLGATSERNRAAFISNLVTIMTTRGYDGIDVDWEPVSSKSSAQFISFINELRNALDGLKPRPLLTAPAMWEPSVYAQLQEKLDQINIMTYELSGPWPGWQVWHNAPLYDGSHRFMSTGASLPSVNSLIEAFLAAGVQPQKLGLGLEFYGALWRSGSGTSTGGATQPLQTWQSAPSMVMIPYSLIMDSNYQSQYYWDSAAVSPYLSLDKDGATEDTFISYDDEKSLMEKVAYAKKKGLGGIMVFELGGGWRPSAATPDYLLQTIKNSVSAGNDG